MFNRTTFDLNVAFSFIMHSVGESAGTTTKAKDAFTCVHAGKTYVNGQQFYPAEAPCKKCICQQGYDGTSN